MVTRRRRLRNSPCCQGQAVGRCRVTWPAEVATPRHRAPRVAQAALRGWAADGLPPQRLGLTAEEGAHQASGRSRGTSGAHTPFGVRGVVA